MNTKRTVAFFWLVEGIFSLAFLTNASAQSKSGLFISHKSYVAGTTLAETDTAAMDSTLAALYRGWKTTYIVPIPDSAEAYIKFNDPQQPNFRCTSEGMGYGMSIVALMAKCDIRAHGTYDALFNYWKLHRSPKGNGLAQWAQYKEGSMVDCSAATDGDIDIAYSMLLAAAQWGNVGTNRYLDEADSLIDRIMRCEVNHDSWVMFLGDDESSWHEERRGGLRTKYSDDYFKTRSSDFMPATFRVFYQERHDDRWLKVIKSTYELFDKVVTLYSPRYGLLPDFISDIHTTPVLGHYRREKHSDWYYNNACRVPWRIGLDYLLTGNDTANRRLVLLNSWAKETSRGDPDRLFSGYKVDGTPKSSFQELYYLGPIGVSEMIDEHNQPWVDTIWKWLQKNIDYTHGKKPDYFGDNIRMLNMIIMSGNYWLPFKLK